MHINRILFYWSQYLGADPKEITLISSLLATVSVVGFFQIVMSGLFTLGFGNNFDLGVAGPAAVVARHDQLAIAAFE